MACGCLGREKDVCSILVTSNALRVEFNNLATVAFCKKAKKALHYFPTVVTRSHFDLTRGKRRSLVHIRSGNTGGLPMLMILAEFLTMQCTKNVSRALHLANGTIGFVVGFQVSTGDNVRVEDCGEY